MSILIQKRHPYTGILNRETSGDSKNAFLHCNDVSGLRPVLRSAEYSCVACTHEIQQHVNTADSSHWCFGTSADAEIKVLRNVDDNGTASHRGSHGEARSTERKKACMSTCSCYSSCVAARSQLFLGCFPRHFQKVASAFVSDTSTGLLSKLITMAGANNPWHLTNVSAASCSCFLLRTTR